MNTNPLTIMEKVFRHLSVDDLKACRLVNMAWSTESTILLRKSSSNVPIGTVPMLLDAISIASSSNSIPFTGFNFSSHFFSSQNCEQAFQTFLSVFATSLESLILTLDKDSETLENFGEFKSLCFPKLVKLEVTGHALDTAPCSRNGEDVPQILKYILSCSPRIESLSIIMDIKSKQTVSNLIQYMLTFSSSLKGLQNLEIYAPVGDQVISFLTKMPFRLKTFKCDFHRSCFLPESLKDFLSSQSDSLEKLVFDNCYGTNCYTVAFPKMPKVKTLKIDGRSEESSKEVSFLPFSYTKEFPSLEKVVLGGSIQLNTCWKILFPENMVVTTVKYLKLKARFIDVHWLKKIATIFPNLEKLYFVLTPRNEPLAEVVFQAFRNITALTIYFHPAMGSRNVDFLLSGFSEPERTSEDLKKLERNVGLSSLKSLQVLHLKADKSSNPAYISDITAQHCLLQMDQLKRITMSNNINKLSPLALTKLREKLDLTIVQ